MAAGAGSSGGGMGAERKEFILWRMASSMPHPGGAIAGSFHTVDVFPRENESLPKSFKLSALRIDGDDP